MQSRTINFINHSQLFSLSSNLIERLDKTRQKKSSERENTKNREKTKLYLSRKYLNCHPSRNSLTYHRRNTKNIFHIFSKQKHKQVDEKIRLFDFLAKNIVPYAAKQLKITFRIILTLLKAFLNHKYLKSVCFSLKNRLPSPAA